MWDSHPIRTYLVANKGFESVSGASKAAQQPATRVRWKSWAVFFWKYHMFKQIHLVYDTLGICDVGILKWVYINSFGVVHVKWVWTGRQWHRSPCLTPCLCWISTLSKLHSKLFTHLSFHIYDIPLGVRALSAVQVTSPKFKMNQVDRFIITLHVWNADQDLPQNDPNIGKQWYIPYIWSTLR